MEDKVKSLDEIISEDCKGDLKKARDLFKSVVQDILSSSEFRIENTVRNIGIKKPITKGEFNQAKQMLAEDVNIAKFPKDNLELVSKAKQQGLDMLLQNFNESDNKSDEEYKNFIAQLVSLENYFDENQDEGKQIKKVYDKIGSSLKTPNSDNDINLFAFHVHNQNDVLNKLDVSGFALSELQNFQNLKVFDNLNAEDKKQVADCELQEKCSQYIKSKTYGHEDDLFSILDAIAAVDLELCMKELDELIKSAEKSKDKEGDKKNEDKNENNKNIIIIIENENENDLEPKEKKCKDIKEQLKHRARLLGFNCSNAFCDVIDKISTEPINEFKNFVENCQKKFDVYQKDFGSIPVILSSTKKEEEKKLLIEVASKTKNFVLDIVTNFYTEAEKQAREILTQKEEDEKNKNNPKILAVEFVLNLINTGQSNVSEVLRPLTNGTNKLKKEGDFGFENLQSIIKSISSTRNLPNGKLFDSDSVKKFYNLLSKTDNKYSKGILNAIDSLNDNQQVEDFLENILNQQDKTLVSDFFALAFADKQSVDQKLKYTKKFLSVIVGQFFVNFENEFKDDKFLSFVFKPYFDKKISGANTTEKLKPIIESVESFLDDFCLSNDTETSLNLLINNMNKIKTKNDLQSFLGSYEAACRFIDEKDQERYANRKLLVDLKHIFCDEGLELNVALENISPVVNLLKKLDTEPDKVQEDDFKGLSEFLSAYKEKVIEDKIANNFPLSEATLKFQLKPQALKSFVINEKQKLFKRLVNIKKNELQDQDKQDLKDYFWSHATEIFKSEKKFTETEASEIYNFIEKESLQQGYLKLLFNAIKALKLNDGKSMSDMLNQDDNFNNIIAIKNGKEEEKEKACQSILQSLVKQKLKAYETKNPQNKFLSSACGKYFVKSINEAKGIDDLNKTVELVKNFIENNYLPNDPKTLLDVLIENAVNVKDNEDLVAFFKSVADSVGKMNNVKGYENRKLLVDLKDIFLDDVKIELNNVVAITHIGSVAKLLTKLDNETDSKKCEPNDFCELRKVLYDYEQSSIRYKIDEEFPLSEATLKFQLQIQNLKAFDINEKQKLFKRLVNISNNKLRDEDKQDLRNYFWLHVTEIFKQKKEFTEAEAKEFYGFIQGEGNGDNQYFKLLNSEIVKSGLNGEKDLYHMLNQDDNFNNIIALKNGKEEEKEKACQSILQSLVKQKTLLSVLIENVVNVKDKNDLVAFFAHVADLVGTMNDVKGYENRKLLVDLKDIFLDDVMHRFKNDAAITYIGSVAKLLTKLDNETDSKKYGLNDFFGLGEVLYTYEQRSIRDNIKKKFPLLEATLAFQAHYGFNKLDTNAKRKLFTRLVNIKNNGLQDEDKKDLKNYFWSHATEIFKWEKKFTEAEAKEFYGFIKDEGNGNNQYFKLLNSAIVTLGLSTQEYLVEMLNQIDNFNNIIALKNGENDKNKKDAYKSILKSLVKQKLNQKGGFVSNAYIQRYQLVIDDANEITDELQNGIVTGVNKVLGDKFQPDTQILTKAINDLNSKNDLSDFWKSCRMADKNQAEKKEGNKLINEQFMVGQEEKHDKPNKLIINTSDNKNEKKDISNNEKILDALSYIFIDLLDHDINTNISKLRQNEIITNLVKITKDFVSSLYKTNEDDKKEENININTEKDKEINEQPKKDNTGITKVLNRYYNTIDKDRLSKNSLGSFGAQVLLEQINNFQKLNGDSQIKLLQCLKNIKNNHLTNDDLVYINLCAYETEISKAKNMKNIKSNKLTNDDLVCIDLCAYETEISKAKNLFIESESPFKELKLITDQNDNSGQTLVKFFQNYGGGYSKNVGPNFFEFTKMTEDQIKSVIKNIGKKEKITDPQEMKNFAGAVVFVLEKQIQYLKEHYETNSYKIIDQIEDKYKNYWQSLISALEKKGLVSDNQQQKFNRCIDNACDLYAIVGFLEWILALLGSIATLGILSVASKGIRNILHSPLQARKTRHLIKSTDGDNGIFSMLKNIADSNIPKQENGIDGNINKIDE